MPARNYSLVVDGNKKCLGCQETKPVAEFKEQVRKNRTGGPYYQSRCHVCRKDRAAQYYRDKRDANPDATKVATRKATLAQYGLTSEQYDEMSAAQNGRCAVCGHAPEGNGVSRHNLVVDHDHVSGKIRSLLCDFCNRGLGIFRDDPDLLLSAAMYIVNHSGGE